MKILFISTGISKNEDYNSGCLGGIEKQIFGISKEMFRLGHTVFIVRKWDSPMEKENIDGITFINIHSWINVDSDMRIFPIGAFFSRLIFSIKASDKIKEIQPDILFVNEKICSYYISKLDIFKVFIVHIPPYEMIKENFTKNRFYQIFFLFLEKLENSILKRFNILISLNQTINQHLLEKGYHSQLIPNGVNINEYNVGKKSNFLLFGGRLVPEKGVLYLLQAYSDLIKKYQYNNKLLIIGSGPSEKSLKDFVSKNNISNYVEFIPWLNDSEFKKKMEDCTVFILPSLFECMPVSLLEAMACGKPVIASNIPGPQDVIIQGYNGFLFEKGNIQELRNYIKLLIENCDLREEIGKNARKTVEKDYSFQRIANKYISLLN